MREFNIPVRYRSSVIASLKYVRQLLDPRKKDFTPTVLDCGSINFKIARHFGFCFGVQNAIEKAYQAVVENQGKNIFLISEMIHNKFVNDDLRAKGVQFLTDKEFINFDLAKISVNDVVIVPAFGTSVDLYKKLSSKKVLYYDTTCPFVERVWRRAQVLGKNGFTIVIHGRRQHEESQATFSHACQYAPSIIIRDDEEAQLLADFILGKVSSEAIKQNFFGAYSQNFNPELHLQKIGIVNQTTMLASETKRISNILKTALQEKYQDINEHFSLTNDTLCYATTENQESVKQLLTAGGDLALVVGGYNSSNTSHLAELLQQSVPTYYIENADEIISKDEIKHFDMQTKRVKTTKSWCDKQPLTILVTAGASCPDITVDEVLSKIFSYFFTSTDFKKFIFEKIAAY